MESVITVAGSTSPDFKITPNFCNRNLLLILMAPLMYVPLSQIMLVATVIAS